MDYYGPVTVFKVSFSNILPRDWFNMTQVKSTIYLKLIQSLVFPFRQKGFAGLTLYCKRGKKH